MTMMILFGTIMRKCPFHKIIFETKFESQEMSINDPHLTPLEEYFDSVGSKVIIIQESYANVPLESSQVVLL